MGWAPSRKRQQRCTDIISSASAVVNLRDQVYLHTGSERHLRHAKRASGVHAVLSKYLGEQFRRAIRHKVLLRECWRAVHQAHKLDDSPDVVQITDGEIQGCQQIDGDAPCGSVSEFGGDIQTKLPDPRLTVLLGNMP